jgi:8-oxo-(d)GTP phosphatase
MTVYLVRHSQAGSRSHWAGEDDSLRPLTSHGRYQSADLVGVLSEVGITEIRSSPYRRCQETVAPLAAALGLVVHVDERLAEGPADAAIAFVRNPTKDNVLLCSHGDVIPGILDDLRRLDGLDLGKDPRCQKGSVWILERDPQKPDSFVTASYVPPR